MDDHSLAAISRIQLFMADLGHVLSIAMPADTLQSFPNPSSAQNFPKTVHSCESTNTPPTSLEEERAKELLLPTAQASFSCQIACSDNKSTPVSQLERGFNPCSAIPIGSPGWRSARQKPHGQELNSSTNERSRFVLSRHE
jgi:hypothetical protein